MTRRRAPSILIGTLVACMAVSASAEDLYIQAATSGSGAGGTLWTTDLMLKNTSSQSAEVEIAFLPRAQDNTSPQVVVLSLAGAEHRVVADILTTLFGHTSANGALRLSPSSDAVIAWSTTQNLSSSGAAVVVFPQRSADTSCAFGDEVNVEGITENADKRTNVGVLNTSALDIVVEATYYRSNGELLGTRSSLLQPFSMLQDNRPVFFLGTTADDAYATLSTTTPGGSFFAYAIVVNNTSGDSFAVPERRPPTTQEPVYVPWVAKTTTRYGTWTSNLQLRAVGGAAADVSIALLKTGQDNSLPQTVQLNILANTSVRISDVLTNQFGYSGTGALRIAATSGNVTITSWADAGSMGWMSHHIPPSPESEAADYSVPLHLIGLRKNVDELTDIGFVNVTDLTITIDLILEDASGTPLVATQHIVPPFGHAQIDDALLGHEATVAAEARTTTQGGRFLAYATVHDLGTEDAAHVGGHVGSGVLFRDGFESGDTSAW